MKDIFKKVGIFLVIIMFSFTFGVTNSRYIGELFSSKSIIANPIITLNSNETSYSISDMLPGDVREYKFSVANFDNSNVNEVLLSYRLRFTLEDGIPLTIKLYDISNGKTEIQLNNGETPKITMNYGPDYIVQNYMIEIIWDKKDNSYEYANKKINCKIQLNAEQVL